MSVVIRGPTEAGDIHWTSYRLGCGHSYEQMVYKNIALWLNKALSSTVQMLHDLLADPQNHNRQLSIFFAYKSVKSMLITIYILYSLSPSSSLFPSFALPFFLVSTVFSHFLLFLSFTRVLVFIFYKSPSLNTSSSIHKTISLKT